MKPTAWAASTAMPELMCFCQVGIQSRALILNRVSAPRALFLLDCCARARRRSLLHRLRRLNIELFVQGIHRQVLVNCWGRFGFRRRGHVWDAGRCVRGLGPEYLLQPHLAQLVKNCMYIVKNGCLLSNISARIPYMILLPLRDKKYSSTCPGP